MGNNLIEHFSESEFVDTAYRERLSDAKIIKFVNIISEFLKASGKTAQVSYSKLKKKNQTISRASAIKVSGAIGKVTYTKTKGDKKITINKKTGKITVKKGLKKGTYKLKVDVKAAGSGSYASATKNVTVKIKVK